MDSWLFSIFFVSFGLSEFEVQSHFIFWKTTIQITIKCDPERARTLREEYSAIVMAWHFNKKHWNKVIIDHKISHDFFCELIRHSYELLVEGLPKKFRDELAWKRRCKLNLQRLFKFYLTYLQWNYLHFICKFKISISTISRWPFFQNVLYSHRLLAKNKTLVVNRLQKWS